ncbi:unnamed protein product [Anisakis simplex]|uniref:Protein neuralized (inferred by orthology to a D. melanogaster protein) n=1 Tax=Anisakis simplex TaxID=6269 RepID=A0A0M3JVN2_ANISI|nr:unnamed protein product [Anisakis simplex]
MCACCRIIPCANDADNAVRSSLVLHPVLLLLVLSPIYEALPDVSLPMNTTDESGAMVNQGTAKLTFHEVHGTNIQLLHNGRVAKRKESFCKGLAFSSRPIAIDEQVCIRFVEVVTNWSGVLRFGVTNVDPSTFRDVELPKFACPDLTSKTGYWAKALPERYSVEGSILHFYVTADGELYYGINGVLKGLFFSGINVSLPIWVIVDIYGNSSSLEFVDPNEARIRTSSSNRTMFSNTNTRLLAARNNLSNSTNNNAVNNNNSNSNRSSSNPSSSTSNPLSNTSTISALVSNNNNNNTNQNNVNMTINNMLSSSTAPNARILRTGAGNNVSLQNGTSSSSSHIPLPSSKYHAGVVFTPLTFHSVRGKHITLRQNYTVAERYTGEYACGYVFTSRPLTFNEKIVIQIINVENAYTGSLAFGLTCCDPVNIQSSTLPVDSDDLLERPEYWVAIKDVAAQPKPTDELSFWITERGEVYFSKNNAPAAIIMYVDTEVKLWAFFDVYGSTQRIRLLGSVKIGSGTQEATQRVPVLPSTSSVLPSSSSARSGCGQSQQQQAPSHRRGVTGLQQTARGGAPPQPPQHKTSLDLTSSLRATGVRLEDLLAVDGTDGGDAASGTIPRPPVHRVPSNVYNNLPIGGSSSSTGNNSNSNSAATIRQAQQAQRYDVHQPQLPRRTFEESGATPAVLDPFTSLSITPASTNQQQLSSTNQELRWHQPSSDPSLLGIFDRFDRPSTSLLRSTPPPPPPPPLPARNSPIGLLSNRPISLISTSSTNINQQPPSQLGTAASNRSLSCGEYEDNGDDECKICMSAKAILLHDTSAVMIIIIDLIIQVNCAIYKCGHTSMCYECAMYTWRERGECPICRKKINDVIKIYRS